MLELHIWGPAFGLPSIDPQCIAVIAYLNITLSKDQWSVIASSNPLLSPTRQLPALRDGRTWAAGFRGIVEYVRKKTGGQTDPDVFLGRTDKAECIAFSAFIETHGQSLIDLSLYVSRKNFNSVTRSIYATLLPFPMQYYTPVAIRSQAKSRTSGLGITTLDIDAAGPPSSTIPPVGAPHTNIPPQAAATSILSATEVVATFKLMNLVRDFLAPLQARLGDSRYFFGDDPSTLDCLAIGYLSLCFYPELPHPWLANEMKKGFERMCGYLNNLRTPLIGEFVDAKEVLTYTRGSAEGRVITPASELPWGEVERGDLPWISGFLIKRALDVIGWGAGTQIKKQTLQQEADMDPEDLERKRKVQAAIRSQRIRGALTVAGGVSAFVGYCLWSGLLQIRLGDGGDGEEEEEEEGGEGEDGGEKEQDEDEEKQKENKNNQDEKELERMKSGNGQDDFGPAGAILGLGRGLGRGLGSDGKGGEVEDEDISPEEEDEIAKDIHAEETEVDEAIAKDIEDHFDDKAD